MRGIGMGQILTAICKCGYEKNELLIGGGMFTFMEVCNVVCYCENCKEVETYNAIRDDINDTTMPLIRNEIRCEKCGNKVTMYGIFTSEDTINDKYCYKWRFDDDHIYLLEMGNHYSPQCGKNTLEFIPSGNYD
jgi:Zn finger protein HypA/HybF involved in hydrogenase expression